LSALTARLTPRPFKTKSPLQNKIAPSKQNRPFKTKSPPSKQNRPLKQNRPFKQNQNLWILMPVPVLPVL
jgi:hypothetical protein